MHGIRGGRLREQVAIQAYTEAADSYGQLIKTYTTRETVRAEVKQLEGTEEDQGGQYQGRQTLRFVMRDTTLTQLDRLTWNGNDYEIIEVIERMHRGRILTVKAALL